MVKRKIFVLFTAAATALLMMLPMAFLTGETHAAEIQKSSSGWTTISADGSPTQNGNALAHAVKGGNVKIRLEKGGVYKRYGSLHIKSNTTIEATGAKIIETKPGSALIYPDQTIINRSKNKGYRALHDVTINGGTWVGVKKPSPTAGSKEGYKIGCNVMTFIHGHDITIKNATIYNVYNAHVIEFIGVKNGKIQNCNIGRKKDGSRGYYRGSANNGAIQLDSCSGSWNNANCKPYDGTPCRSIKIYNNRITYTTGIETAQRTKKKASYISIKNNRIRYHYKAYILKHVSHVTKSGNKTSRY